MKRAFTILARVRCCSSVPGRRGTSVTDVVTIALSATVVVEERAGVDVGGRVGVRPPTSPRHVAAATNVNALFAADPADPKIVTWKPADPSALRLRPVTTGTNIPPPPVSNGVTTSIGVVGQVPAGQRRHPQETDRGGAEGDGGQRFQQHRGPHSEAVDEGAVARAQVGHHHAAVHQLEAEVQA